MKNYKRVIHIHTDLKFIKNGNRFEGNLYENEVFFLGDSDSTKKIYSDSIVTFSYTPHTVRTIVKRCKKADLVVFYGLDTIKAKIILKLPKAMPVAWRFFGYELYNFDNDLSFSKKTLKTFKKRRSRNLISKSKIYFSAFKSLLRWGVFSETYYLKAIDRINFLLCFSKQEYDLLLSRWTHLPHFVRLPILRKYKPEANAFTNKDKLLIIGNNRSSYNNNLDVIELIEAAENRILYQFVILFNYGPESSYSRKVREEVNGKPYYALIDDFLPLEKFEELYSKASAAVFNGYRQMALGNIFEAIRKGVKLYLNDRNIIKDWLCSEGINIYSIEDLKHDLREGMITLTEKELKENAENFKKMIDSYTNEDFQKTFCDLLNKEQ